MRPKNPIYCKAAVAFERDFAKRFGGRRVLKTAFHFFHWATKGDEAERERLLAKFTAYSHRNGFRASWRNAADWYERIQRGVVNGTGA